MLRVRTLFEYRYLNRLSYYIFYLHAIEHLTSREAEK